MGSGDVPAPSLAVRLLWDPKVPAPACAAEIRVTLAGGISSRTALGHLPAVFSEDTEPRLAAFSCLSWTRAHGRPSARTGAGAGVLQRALGHLWVPPAEHRAVGPWRSNAPVSRLLQLLGAFDAVAANGKADTSVRAVTAPGGLGGAGAAAGRQRREAGNGFKKRKNRRIWAQILFFFYCSQMSLCAGSLALRAVSKGRELLRADEG